MSKMLPHIIIASCKGGVGKSTITAAMANIIQSNYGIKVGVLDMDIWGASQHILMDCESVLLDNHSKPFTTKSGVELFSMGMISRDPIIWRAPIALKFVTHMLNNIKWPSAELLIVDTPPGTSDVLISLCKSLQGCNSKAVTVTSPQYMASKIGLKSDNMFKKFNIPVVHSIINMASIVCSACGHYDAIDFNPDNNTVIPFDKRTWKNQNITDIIAEHLHYAIAKIFK